MVEGRYRKDFDLIIAHTTMISQSFSGSFDPIKANPYREASESQLKRTPEQRKDAAKTGIKAIGQALAGMFKKKSTKKKK